MATGRIFWSLFCTKLSGEAVGNVTPASHVGGEVAKAYMLRDRVSVTQGVPTLVINKTVELVSGLVFALIGTGLAVGMFPLPVEVQIGLGAALVVGTVGIVAAYVSQRQRASVWLLDVLKKLRLSFLESRREKFEEVDRTIAAFYRQNRLGFWLCMVLHMLSWVLGTFEVYAILSLLGQPQPFLTAFLLTSLSLIINTAFFFIPSGVGVFESGHVFLFQLLGLTPELGLGVALIRAHSTAFLDRVRVCFDRGAAVNILSVGGLNWSGKRPVVHRSKPAPTMDGSIPRTFVRFFLYIFRWHGFRLYRRRYFVPV